MVDVFKVAEVLVENVKENYGKDVGIIAYYGSYAIGEASETSDLDMFYIPDEGKTVPLYSSFIFQELPFEFWPVSWEFAEKIASGKQSYAVAPSLIANAKVLYARSEEDLKKFNALQKRIEELQKPENKRAMMKEAEEVYKVIPFYFEKLALSIKENDVTSIRTAALEFIDTSVDCLALMNQTYFNRVWWANDEKLQSFEIKPEKLLESIRTISTSEDFHEIEETALRLKEEIRELLLAEQKRLGEREPFQEVFKGYYPGVFEYTNKVRSACNKKNEIAMFAAATKLQNEMSLMLSSSYDETDDSSLRIYKEYRKTYDDLELPDVASHLHRGDFDIVSEKIQALDERAMKLMKGNAVAINQFEELEDLRVYINEASNE